MLRVILVGAGLLLFGFVGSGYAGHRHSSWLNHMFSGPDVKGSGHLTTEDRSVGEFDQIESSTAADLIITVGGTQHVSLTFDENLLDRITTRVEGRTLIIETRGSWSSRHDCKIEITVPSLQSVDCSGSGDIEVHQLKGDEFNFSLAGSGNMEADGAVDRLSIHISGSGDVMTRELKANDVEVSISGSGNAVVYAADNLDGRVSGSGDIRYVNEPAHVDSHVSGSGSIHRGR